MNVPAHLFWPFASSLGYVVAVLLVKRSTFYGVGLWRTTFVANLASGLCFTPLWWVGGAGQPAAMLWQPALVGALFFAGQVCTFWAINGDVSVATPVLGLKILLVALLSSFLLSDPVPLKWWVAAGLSTAAIGLLNGGAQGTHRQVGRTILAASLAAASYALFDVLVQKWAPVWGAGRFLPWVFWSLSLYSFALIPFFRAPIWEISRPAWQWLLPGALVLGLQAVGMTFALGVYGDATAMNVVYSSRGLWSVIAVWLVGHWFRNEEQMLGATVLRWRLMGALLMLAAIVLVMV